jgi:hypothetical protein
MLTTYLMILPTIEEIRLQGSQKQSIIGEIKVNLFR